MEDERITKEKKKEDGNLRGKGNGRGRLRDAKTIVTMNTLRN